MPANDRLAAAALVAANLLPLAMVLLGHWSTAGVLLAYWLENLVIGGYALLRILFAGGSPRLQRAGNAAFFVVHYGIFCAAHGGILVELFEIAPMPKASLPLAGELLRIARAAPEGLWLAALLLAGSHGVSFVRHYLLGGERPAADADAEMVRPYGRIVLMHVVVLGAAMLIEELGAPAGALVLLVVLKTGFDLVLHRKAHATPARVEA